MPDMPEDTVATERWLPVVDFEGYYEVSDHGRVRSVSRVIPILGGSPRRLRGRLMAPTLGAYGYPTISLWRNNKGILVKVHKLVLEAFVQMKPDGAVCRHLDGNPLNNHISNIQWGTQSENIFDQVRHGTHPEANRDACPLGHLLVSPNLRHHHARRGTRGCLACSRARSRQHYAKRCGRPLVDFKVLADRYYGQLMGHIPSDEPRKHCTSGHWYTPETSRVLPSGSHVCLTCRNDARRKRAKG